MATFTATSKSSINTTVADGVDISLGNGLLGVGGGDYFGIGQTFQISTAFPLYSAGFWVSNFNNDGDPGTLVAEIYEVTGTVGTNAVPTGSAVLVSEVVSQSDIPNGNVLAEVVETEFVFNNVPILNAGDYALILRLDSIVYPVGVARKTSGSVHYGNGLAKLDGDWLASSTVDYVCALNEFESNSAEVDEMSKNFETFSPLSKNAETFTATSKNLETFTAISKNAETFTALTKN